MQDLSRIVGRVTFVGKCSGGITVNWMRNKVCRFLYAVKFPTNDRVKRPTPVAGGLSGPLQMPLWLLEWWILKVWYQNYCTRFVAAMLLLLIVIMHKHVFHSYGHLRTFFVLKSYEITANPSLLSWQIYFQIMLHLRKFQYFFVFYYYFFIFGSFFRSCIVGVLRCLLATNFGEIQFTSLQVNIGRLRWSLYFAQVQVISTYLSIRSKAKRRSICRMK